jgi:uncharacterized membrane protein
VSVAAQAVVALVAAVDLPRVEEHLRPEMTQIRTVRSQLLRLLRRRLRAQRVEEVAAAAREAQPPVPQMPTRAVPVRRSS